VRLPLWCSCPEELKRKACFRTRVSGSRPASNLPYFNYRTTTTTCIALVAMLRISSAPLFRVVLRQGPREQRAGAYESGSESRFHQPALTCRHHRSPNTIHAPSDSSSCCSHETYRPRLPPPLPLLSHCPPSRARRRNPRSHVWPSWAVCLA
jgi:hypothetical protein